MGKRVLAASACVTATLVLLLGGCLGSETSSCGDVLCPPETVCAKDFGSCFAADAVSGCKGQDNGSTCATSSFEDGVCDRGVCFASSCGDGVINGNEVCDDGAREGGDGCSADCMSDESCGNGITDDVVGEECDCGDGSGAITAGCIGANSETAGATCRTSCVAHCGDSELNSSEQCEPDVLIAETCVDLGFDLGAIACGQLCQLDFQSCSRTGWQPVYDLDNSLGTSDLIVVSANLAYAGDGRRVLKFDGTSWTTNFTSEDPVQHVWATAENDVWVSTIACGNNGSGVFQCRLRVFQDEGSGWVMRRTTTNETEGALWGTGPDDLYLAGSVDVLHWNGTDWTNEVSTTIPNIFHAISGNGTGDVWVVGRNGISYRKRDGSWDKTTGPNHSGTYKSIWAQGDDVWLGGVSRTFHWDGNTWARTLLPAASGQVSSLWAGDSGLFASTYAAVYQFAEENWLELDSPCAGRISGVSEPWMGCAGAVSIYQGHGWGRLPDQEASRFSAQARNDIWAIDLLANQEAEDLYHFDGEAWTQVSITAGNPERVMATSNTLYLAGRNQWIAALKDGVETTIRSGAAAQPSALWANNAGLVVVPEREPATVQSNADYRIAWKDGDAAWQERSFDRNIFWADAHGKERTVVVIGNEEGAGVITRFTGSDWQIVKEVQNQLQGVWVQDQDNAVVVGTGGFVLFYLDGVWSEQVLPEAKNLIAVSGTSMSDLFAITEFNEIWHFDGVAWSEFRGLDTQRFDVQVTPDSILYLTESGVDAWIR